MSGELASNYQQIETLYSSLIDQGLSCEDNVVSDGIDLTQLCIEQREKLDLFSKNEEMEDFSTSIIKYLYLEFYLAKFHTQCLAQDTRHLHLASAKRYFEAFLERCCTLPGLLHKDEVSQFAVLFPDNFKSMFLVDDKCSEGRTLGFDGEDSDTTNDGAEGCIIAAALSSGRTLSMKQATPSVFNMTPEEQRNHKIARFRREQENKKRIKTLRAAMANRSGGKITSGGASTGACDGTSTGTETPGEEQQGSDELEEDDAEDELREIYILQLQS